MTTTIQQEPRPQTKDAGSFLRPNVNIFENKSGYVLQAEMPGVNKDGLEVTLDGSELTIIGRRTADTTKTETLYRESRPLDYRRVFELDPVINASRIEAKIDQGVLTLRLPKQEQIKPRKIAVTE